MTNDELSAFVSTELQFHENFKVEPNADKGITFYYQDPLSGFIYCKFKHLGSHIQVVASDPAFRDDVFEAALTAGYECIRPNLFGVNLIIKLQ